MKQCSIEGCARKQWARGFCAPHYSNWHRAQKKYTITCGWCGKTAQVERKRLRYCSVQCAGRIGNQARAAQQNAERIAKLLPVPYTGPPHQRKPRPTPRQHRSRRSFTSGRCVVCTAWFVTSNTDVTCSTECQQAHHRLVKQQGRDKRRARKKDAFVENVYRKRVYERDGYRCHICRKKTNPTKEVPHPKAPTIDHVIPLADGGTHEPLNCRTACFMCNTLKGHRGSGEQLLLIA